MSAATTTDGKVGALTSAMQVKPERLTDAGYLRETTQRTGAPNEELIIEARARILETTELARNHRRKVVLRLQQARAELQLAQEYDAEVGQLAMSLATLEAASAKLETL